MPSLTSTEMVAFLAEPGHLVRIGTIRPDGSPLVVPTWRLPLPDEDPTTFWARRYWE